MKQLFGWTIGEAGAELPMVTDSVEVAFRNWWKEARRYRVTVKALLKSPKLKAPSEPKTDKQVGNWTYEIGYVQYRKLGPILVLERCLPLDSADVSPTAKKLQFGDVIVEYDQVGADALKADDMCAGQPTSTGPELVFTRRIARMILLIASTNIGMNLLSSLNDKTAKFEFDTSEPQNAELSLGAPVIVVEPKSVLGIPEALSGRVFPDTLLEATCECAVSDVDVQIAQPFIKAYQMKRKKLTVWLSTSMSDLTAWAIPYPQKEGGYAPMPRFLGLAHELIHCLRILSGKLDLSPPLAQFKYFKTHTMEEVATILGVADWTLTENSMRVAMGIPVRETYEVITLGYVDAKSQENLPFKNGIDSQSGALIDLEGGRTGGGLQEVFKSSVSGSQFGKQIEVKSEKIDLDEKVNWKPPTQ